MCSKFTINVIGKKHETRMCVYHIIDRAGCDDIETVHGEWHPVNSLDAPGEHSVTLKEGVTHGYQDTVGSSWGEKLGIAVSAGFDVGVASGSVEISHEWSLEMSKQYSTMFSRETTIEHTVKAEGPGAIWQWQFRVRDNCGSSTAAGFSFSVTNSSTRPPCCLPGHFKNASEPLSGDCDGPNLCPFERKVAKDANAKAAFQVIV